MLPIAGQTAGPNWLKFVVDTHGWPGVSLAKKNSNFLFHHYFHIFFYGQRRALKLVYCIS